MDAVEIALSVAIPALCGWRENRGGGTQGMQSVLNVLANRAARDHTSLYAEAIKRLQFSSMTAGGDPELVLFPIDDLYGVINDPQYLQAEQMARWALAGNLPDLTAGATDYYAPLGLKNATTLKVNGKLVPFPSKWNSAKVVYTATVADQLFFKEV
jgi:Cell Wall Hydrolase